MIKIAICDDEQPLVSVNREIAEEFIKEKKELETIEEYGNKKSI